MPITPYSSSDLTRSRNVRQIYSGYRINIQANQLGIPAIPTTIKGPSFDIWRALAEGPINFTPVELAAILRNNSGSTTATSGPPGPPGPPGPTPIVFSSDTAIAPNLPGSYQIPAGYTRINYVLIAGGGGGEFSSTGTGGGGGSGGIIKVTEYAVTPGATLSVTLGTGGAVSVIAAAGDSGTPTTLTLGGVNQPEPTGGEGGGAPGGGGGGAAGSPDGIPGLAYDPDPNSVYGGKGGYLPSPYTSYGRGGNGDTFSSIETVGGNGFYYIQLYSQAPPPLTFTSINGTPLPSPYTIPSGYTLLTYVIIGGGGGGGDDGYQGGMGGGSGGITGGIASIGAATSVSITLGTGGLQGDGGVGANVDGGSGTATILTLNSVTYTAGGGAGGTGSGGGAGGTPGGVNGDNSNGEGGSLPSPYGSYGYGGNGAGPGATDGRPGYYTITLT